ncbi:MAG: hypothetical protein ACTSPV_18505, partial [Candidatus Hodarchaeales archaeon]
DAGTIGDLDFMEGEGSLYFRIVANVFLLDKKQYVKAYTYYPSDSLIKEFLANNDVDGES